ncbi:MAG TPA: TolC family protein [Dysgonomonas sp.]|nr:TolC family protein [Dysgonomonas sp.]
MKNVLLILLSIIISINVFPQSENQSSLAYYIREAKLNSPLIKDYLNQQIVSDYELQRLKAFYTQSKLDLAGNYLFVPIIAKDNGKTAFKWNNPTATDYYGYDLGQTGQSLQAGITWSKPLLGRASYKLAEEQIEVDKEISKNNIRLQEHDLEKLVTDQYILCLLNKKKIAFSDSLLILLDQQTDVVQKLAKVGIMKQSDIKLLHVEIQNNKELQETYKQSYRKDLLDLNILCGIRDTSIVILDDINIDLRLPIQSNSLFLEQYRLDSLNLKTLQNVSEIQYKPQLNFFVDGGLRFSEFNKSVPKHFGMSAGITFTWTLFDGKQRKLTRNKTNAQLSTISFYRENFILQNDLKRKQCLTELKSYDARKKLLITQVDTYNQILSDYKQEINKGQRSMVDFITVLRSRTQTVENQYLLDANRLLLINTYNNANW